MLSLANESTNDEVTKGAPLLPLKVKGLTLTRKDKQLVKGIDLMIDSPGITMILGQNGSGKTLLLRMLHGLLEPTSGTISWNGTANSAQIRHQQAMVFQRPVLLRRSVQANMDFVLKLNGKNSNETRDALLRRVGLLDHARQPARLLSGGEQQRLALARALASNPEVLFLDEPTASLDPTSVLTIEDIVMQVSASGTKVIFVTHDISQARRLGHDIVFLEDGKIAEQASAEQFFNSPKSRSAQAYLEGRIVLPNETAKEDSNK